MPVIQVAMGSGRTPEQKRAMLEGIVAAVHDSTGAALDSIKVWIVELDPDEVMLGDETLAERRARS